MCLMKTPLPPLFLLSFTAWAGCFPVTGDRILGRDLALADPLFATLPASLVIGSAPVPGMKRTFATGELTRIARAHGIAPGEPAEVCFDMPLREMNGEEARKEMRRALPAGELAAELTIIELSKAMVPAGKMEFPLTGLEAPAAGQPAVQLWRGYVRYSETRKLSVWARVSISQMLTAVVAQRDLPANVPIAAGSVRLEKREGPPVITAAATRLEDVLGRIPRRSVKAGGTIPLAILASAPDVRRGDAVPVEVVSGPARLLLSAIAERDGRNGELVELRNPSSGKTFRARLDGLKAVIVVGQGRGL